ncbi:MAG: amino acid ABC transporter permease [Anaerovoracaceae bacterium]|jgi:His/Glu/Gln/Arg/opine family amino acid ABC transporter permease subunit|nr:amino acid ABC transporter permease [Anaerovoracaceae bacterium]
MNSFFQDVQHNFYQSFVERDRWALYLDGLKISFIVMLGALALGIILGILVAVVRTAHDQKKKEKSSSAGLSVLNAIVKVYVTVIRGTPMMVQLLIMGLVVFAQSRNLIMIAILTLGINSGAYVSETIRSGIQSINPGQMEAGRSLGMSYGTVMRLVIIPQAIKNILPALGNEMIILFKDTSLVTVIGLADLTKVAIQIQARTYQAFMPFVGIALVYLAVVMLMTWGLGKVERRLAASDRS